MRVWWSTLVMRCRWVEAIVVVGAVVCLFERCIVHPVTSRHVGSGSFWDGKAFIFMEISWGWHACMHCTGYGSLVIETWSLGLRVNEI
jgi:hypothetical protein